MTTATTCYPIVATEAVSALARKALQIQDACNPRAVARFLVECQDTFRDGGHDHCHQHPVTLAVLNKLNHLAHLEQSRTECFTACGDLADGRDIDWPITP